jgi:hypothetical protein
MDVAQGRPLVDVRRSYINDGDISSSRYWSEHPSSGWIEMDLQVIIDVTHVTLWHIYNDDEHAARTYQSVVILISSDGKEWHQIFNNDDFGKGDFSAWCGIGYDGAYVESSLGKNITLGQWDPLTNTTTTKSFRYIRVHGIGPQSDLVHTIVELQIYDINGNNMALHAPVSMAHAGPTSGYNGYPITIGAPAQPSYAIVDLLHVFNLTTIEIGLSSEAEELICAMVVQLSEDQQNWHTIWNNDHADTIGQGVGSDVVTPAPLLIIPAMSLGGMPLTRYIRIWLRCGDNDAQILNRVRAYADFPDVAQGRPSFMINGADASFGNDGIMGQLLDQPYDGHPAADARCAATPSSPDDAWWMVDLGRPKYQYVLMLYQLIVPGFTSRLAHFQVYIGNTSTAYNDDTAVHVFNASAHYDIWSQPVFQVPLAGVLGRYLWVAVWGTERIITICEAMISACPPGSHANDGFQPCIDINECLDNNGGCGTTQCINLDGGHMCKPIVDETFFAIDGRAPSMQDGQLVLDRTSGGQVLSARVTWVGRTFPITIQYGSLDRVYTCTDPMLTLYASTPLPQYIITCRSSLGVGTNMSLWLEVTPFDAEIQIRWPRGKLAYRYPTITSGTLELVPSASSPSTYLNIFDKTRSHKVTFAGTGFAADASRMRVYLGDDRSATVYNCPLVVTGDEHTTDAHVVCTIPAGIFFSLLVLSQHF